MREPAVVTITGMGAEGDGMAESPGGPVYVPLALPGERVRVAFEKDRAHLVAVIAASGDRREALCRHFGTCGGCALQHWAPEPYQAWKVELVRGSLRARGLDPPILPLRPAFPGERRRAVLSARRAASGVFLGFFEEGTHSLVDILECPVLDPRIVASLPGLRDLLGPLVSRRAALRVSITLMDTGLDVGVSGFGRTLDPALRARLAEGATAARLNRLSIDGEAIVRSGVPVLTIAGVSVSPPTGAFLQASRQAEEAISGLIVAALGKRVKRVADLYCGLGTFTFALAARARVLAIDSDRELVQALDQAARGASGLKPIETKVRDLMREPLSALEMKDFDAVVLDPPRAGSLAQAERLARAEVGTIVCVSCNPVTLARDLRILVDGGYAIESVSPVDQFLFSPHVEAVAVLRRR